MGKVFRILYTLVVLFLVVFYVYEYSQDGLLDRNEMIYPFLLGLIMLAAFFSVFLVKALFEGEFKIFGFLELVGAFLLLLIVQNAEANRLIFINLLVVLLGVSVYKLSKKPKEELE